MSGGRAPKTKGDHGEREICKLLGGERTYWQPGSEKTQGDVINVPYLGRVEVKRRRDGWKQLYSWLANVDAVAVRADRKEWLVILRAEDVKLLCEQMDELKKRGAADAPKT